MHVTVTTQVAAGREQIWSVMADVSRWPEWTESIDRVEQLDDGPLRLGSRVKVRQPGFPAVVWTVTEFDEGTSFTWQARSPGLVSTGRHSIVDGVDGATGAAVELGFSQTGALAPLMRALFGKKSRRFVQMEADGLRARCTSSGLATG